MGKRPMCPSPTASYASSWLPEIVSIPPYFAHCIHAYILCAPQGGSFLSSRPAQSRPVQSHPVLFLRATPYLAALLGPPANSKASFLHQILLPGELLPACLGDGGVSMPNTRLHLPGGRPSSPRDFLHSLRMPYAGWPVSGLPQNAGPCFLRARCGKVEAIGPHIAKSSGKSRQAQGRRRRIFLALLPTQGAAYASRHV